jgi:hypothetical protein
MVVLVYTFSVGLALPTLAGIDLLRTETIFTGFTLDVLLACGAHLVLPHESKKGWSTNITRLEKMSPMLFFHTL